MPNEVTGILVAGGSSVRMGFDKVWVDLCGRPLLAWPLLAFSECKAVNEVVLVVATDAHERASELLVQLGVEARVVTGGPRRRDSVFAGLQSATGEWVAVHDVARPLVSADLILRGLEAARETGAAIAAVPETNTVKQVRGDLVDSTLDRAAIWAAQTPQVFRRDLLLEAHRRSQDDATDDAALVEAMGGAVKVYEGAYANIKVTHPLDLKVAAFLLSQRRGPPPFEGRGP